MNSLQALVTGMIAGALSKEPQMAAIDVEVVTDQDGNYLPEVHVTGRESGTRLRVFVVAVEEEESHDGT